MSLSDWFTFAPQLLKLMWTNVKWFPAAVALGVILIAVAGTTRRTWVQCLVGFVFLAASATYSIWVLQLGWLLAALGLLLIVLGAAWRLLGDRASKAAESSLLRAHASGGLVWPGLGLLLAPFANVLVLMPVLRQFIR
jgi:hypothetical protein